MNYHERILAFRQRDMSSAPGKFYIDDQCIDCDLCRETAPTIFRRNDILRRSYVFKQPGNEEELLLTKEALRGCYTEAIHDDGETFDWQALPPKVPDLPSV